MYISDGTVPPQDVPSRSPSDNLISQTIQAIIKQPRPASLTTCTRLRTSTSAAVTITTTVLNTNLTRTVL